MSDGPHQTPEPTTTPRAPRSPGWRAVLRGAFDVHQPPLHSLIGSVLAVSAVLGFLGFFVSGLDGRFHKVLFSAVTAPEVLALFAAGLLSTAALLTLSLPLSLSGEPRHLSPRQRTRYAFTCVLFALGLVAALLAAAGRAL